MIKAICFDLDGVFFSGESFKTFKQCIVAMGVSIEDVDYYLHKEPMIRFKRGETDEEEFWKEAFRYWNIECSLETIKSWLKESYSVNQDVLDTVRKVRENGYKACVISNNFITRVNALQEQFGFIDEFDLALFSYEVGVTKPSKEIFEKLIKALGVLPEEIALADDHEPNIEGVRALGINAFLYEDFKQFKSSLVKLGVSL